MKYYYTYKALEKFKKIKSGSNIVVNLNQNCLGVIKSGFCMLQNPKQLGHWLCREIFTTQA